MERAILVRHGESDFSARELVNGEIGVACPLTPRGVEQARTLAADLADEEIDLCVTSALERARETAAIALAGRPVPQLVFPELNDPRYGRFEGGPLADYLRWAHAHGSADEPGEGGESRAAIARRYSAGFRKVLERPERTVLVVTHSLPISYALMALSGQDPARRVDLVAYAEPYPLSSDELELAVARLEAWCAAPTW